MIPADTTPKPGDCPLVVHAHESRCLPWPRSEQHALLVTPPGSILVVGNGRCGGFARGTEDSRDVFMYQMLRRLKLHGQNAPKTASPRHCEKIVFLGGM